MSPRSSDAAHFLGIDCGTSGIRAVVVDTSLNRVADSQCSLNTHGNNRRDAAIWWAALETVLIELGQQFDMSAVRALAIDATSGTVLATSTEGVPVADALMYNDTVDDNSILAAIANVAPNTSAVHGASSALARAISLQQQHPTATRLLHQADWLVGKISGNFGLSDESNALKTGYDPVTRSWPGWINDTGLDASWLPKVIAAGEVVGRVSQPFASRFGFGTDTRIISGMTDGCASFLATGASSLGDCVTALGTTMTMKLLCDKPLFEPQFGIYSHRLGDRWLAGGASNSGGNVLAHFFKPDELQRLSALIEPLNPTDLNYYPLVNKGERFPHNDPEWPPRLTPRPSEDHVFLQGLFEGMASIEADGYQRLVELGASSPTSIRSVGGGAVNDVWTTIRQRALNIKVATSLSTDAAFGMAKFAFESARAY